MKTIRLLMLLALAVAVPLTPTLALASGQIVDPSAQVFGLTTVYNLGTSTPVLMGSLANRKNVTIQNLGPNALYCGFLSNITSTTASWQIAAGQTWPADYSANVRVYCLATTALQVSPANTRVIEAN